MVQAFALLLVFQLVGEVLAQALGLPVPGPLVGMLLLFAALLVHGRMPDALRDAAGAMLRHLMLLFIPAVTGVMMYFDRLASDALAFMVACLLGAAASLVATGLTLKWMLRLTGERPQAGDGGNAA